MLSSITQLLTLAAFTVHAVLGCCWHHSHSACDGGCLHPSGHAVVESGFNHVSHAHRDHCHASQQHAHAAVQGHALRGHVAASSPRVAAVEATYCSDAPCHHSRDCDGPDCSYLRIDSTSVPPSATQLLGWLAGLDVRICEPAEVVSLANNGGASQASVPLRTASQVCAVLQSWQI